MPCFQCLFSLAARLSLLLSFPLFFHITVCITTVSNDQPHFYVSPPDIPCSAGYKETIANKTQILCCPSQTLRPTPTTSRNMAPALGSSIVPMFLASDHPRPLITMFILSALPALPSGITSTHFLSPACRSRPVPGPPPSFPDLWSEESTWTVPVPCQVSHFHRWPNERG